MKAYHKVWGEVELISKDNVSMTVLYNGEEKRISNKFMSLKPFEKYKRPVTIKKELTEEDRDFLSSIQGKLRWLDKKSTENYRNGRSGAY